MAASGNSNRHRRISYSFSAGPLDPAWGTVYQLRQQISIVARDKDVKFSFELSERKRGKLACADGSFGAAGRVPNAGYFSQCREMLRNVVGGPQVGVPSGPGPPGPALAQRNRRAGTPAAGLEARPTINAGV